MARRGYHHGDLREALIQAADDALETGGPEMVSLRELAKALGVSTAAPYRHFPDRRALLSEVAAHGFTRLTREYAQAAAGADSATAALRATSRVYLGLAFRRPGLFRLMFDSDLLGPGAPQTLLEPAAAAWEALFTAVANADPAADIATTKRRTITGWSTLHGFITLVQGGRLRSFMTDPLTEAELVEAILDKTLVMD